MGFFCALSFTLLCSFSIVMGESKIHERQTFIVRVQNEMKPSDFSDVEDWYKSTLHSLSSNPLNSENLTTTTQRGKNKDLLYVYKTVFQGFSATLTKQQAQILKRRPEILGVFPDRVHQVQITRSPHFLGLITTSTPNNLLKQSNYGSNVVIGILDTGIWPERLSFRDEDLEPIPSHWKGECMKGEKFSTNLCNKKLVGARYFTNGYEASIRAMNKTTSIKSPRDSNGHGTHTASTAAGMHVNNASFLNNFAKGIAKGIAPKARIAVYKVCWDRGCLDSDILAAFDKAVEDGVDVISLSLGGEVVVPYYIDPIAIGSFGAMEKGVVVSTSAGNEGPRESSVSNIAPWIITVGASTIDRQFPADLLLEDGRHITGASLYKGDDAVRENTFLPIIYAGNASFNSNVTYYGSGYSSAICLPNSLDPELVRGKIVVCDRGGIPRAAKGLVVKEAGGAGVIVANVASDGEGLIADAHLIPGLEITGSASNTVRTYISSSQNPKAKMVFHGTQVGVKPAPVIASFSSRGPNSESIYVLKPDLVAPGVNILAAWPDDASPTGLSKDSRRTEFNILSGTSMSCPHVSGLAALLKGVHPNWSPAMIRSALMTTAYVVDLDSKPLLDETTNDVATVWDMGAGHVDPEKAIDPGLVYDLTVNDYLNFLCASNISSENIRLITRRLVNCSEKPRQPWDLNYPAISVAFDVSGPSKLEVVVMRTVTHVSDGVSSYTVTITNPKGVVVTVDPPKMEFKRKGEKQSYMVQIVADNMTVPSGNTKSEFGRLMWKDEKHLVTSPIVVVWTQP